jgi:hypothetical protein
MFEKADKKAVLMAREQFVQKCKETEKDLTITQDDDGFYTLKSEQCDNIISFNVIPSLRELADMFVDQLGYAEDVAEIACCKFGEEQLDGEAKLEFFGNNPQNEFSNIQNHVELKGENILVKDYTCLRITPKAEGVPCLVFRDENNNFAVLNPEKMKRSQMAEVIRESLGIEDEKTVAALVDKAEKVNDFYAKQNVENFSYNAGGLGRASLEIERNNKNEFSVNFTNQSDDVRVLSFSDKKNALSELTAMFRSQGLSADEARQNAKAVFKKAQSQSAEKVLQIEEIKVNRQSAEVHGTASGDIEPVATVRYGGRTDEIELADREKAKLELMENYGVCEEEAELMLSQADDKIGDDVAAVSQKKSADNVELNGHERTPAPKVEADIKPETAEVPELPKAPAPRRR